MDKETNIALFKYRIIAPLLNDDTINKKEYYQKMSEKELDWPYKDKRRVKPETFKKWLIKYYKDGFEGLKPSFRKDKGYPRSISPQLQEKIIALVKKYRFHTVKNLYDYLVTQQIITQKDFTYATLNNYIKANNLFNPSIQKKPRKAFETEHVNQLWMMDFMYGPYVKHGKRKVRTYLCAAIDDYSRFIISAEFYYTQSIISLEETLKDAILKYGIPNKLYCDNGKVFIDNHFTLISARLGFIIIHSKPHEAAPRGKIERWFRTVRESFIPNLYIKQKEFTLKELNSEFNHWLSQQYNLKVHSTIATTPFNRFFFNRQNIKIRKKSSQIVKIAFLHTVSRKVNNDATVSFEGKLYETDPKYIGKKIEIRHDPVKEDELYVFEKDKQISKLKKLDKQANAKFPARFHTTEEK